MMNRAPVFVLALACLGCESASPPDPAAERRDEAARRLVAFLASNGTFPDSVVADSVILYVSPEGGGGRATVSRERLAQPSAWVVRSGGRNWRSRLRRGWLT